MATRPAAGVRGPRHLLRLAVLCAAPPVKAASPPAVPRGPQLRPGYVVPELPRLTDLIRQSGELPAISRHPPVIGLGPCTFIGSSCLSTQDPPPHLPGFYCCTVQDCRLQYAVSRAPLRAPQFFRSGTGASGKGETLGNSIHPACCPISFMRECLFGASFVRSRFYCCTVRRLLRREPRCVLLSFRSGTGHRVRVAWIPHISFMRECPALHSRSRLLARPPGCPVHLPAPPASQGFYFRAFRSPGLPMCLPDITTAPN